jgi:benzoyl-CoA reductase/2-hydroxyglutaryl-CoA dehydratase subunit BcrC/BadD/HgdB
MKQKGAMAVLQDAASRIDPPAVMRWREEGRPIVGTTCSFVPAEILYAAGILPIRLRGLAARGSSIGDAYFGPFICSFPKCLLELAGAGAFRFLDGAVITPGCDAMRRLHECWRKAGEDIPGIVPGFFHYFDVPHKAEAHGFSWFVDEMKVLVERLSSHFNRNVTDEDLRSAVSVYDEGRRLYETLEGFLLEDGPRVTGTEVFASSIAGSVLPREEYNELMRQAVEEAMSRAPADESTIRLVVAGSVDDTPDLFRLIEGGGKALVVGETLCFGSRFTGNIIEASEDPLHAIAGRYLSNSTCPRMFGGYAERLERLLYLVRSRRAHGVILQNVRFCDMHGSENGLMARDLKKIGIPALRIEREYGPLADTGRIKLRLDAFLEQIAAKRPTIKRVESTALAT